AVADWHKHNLHRRRLWEAWKAVGERCGRWSALAGLGARIRAADLEGYRTPKPLIRRQFPFGGPDSRGMYRVKITDPRTRATQHWRSGYGGKSRKRSAGN